MSIARSGYNREVSRGKTRPNPNPNPNARQGVKRSDPRSSTPSRSPDNKRLKRQPQPKRDDGLTTIKNDLKGVMHVVSRLSEELRALRMERQVQGETPR